MEDSGEFGRVWGKINILQVKVSGSQPPKQSQRTAKPTAICEVCTASGKGVVNSAFFRFRGCIGKKARKYCILTGVGGNER